MRILLLVASLLALSGCAQEPNVEAGPSAQRSAERVPSVDTGEGYRAQFERIHGASYTGRPGSLCFSLHFGSAGAGAYVVRSIESFVEHDDESGQFHPHTYVKLDRVEAWTHDAPKDPVLRISGGGYPDGKAGGWLVSLAVGETYGLALVPPTKENLGFHAVERSGVFAKREDGRYTNGHIFTKAGVSLDELGDAIADRAGLSLEECKKNDIRSDWDPALLGEMPVDLNALRQAKRAEKEAAGEDESEPIELLEVNE